jgi:CBS domain containing-hemolysin-like protein
LSLVGRTVGDELVPWSQVLTVRDTAGPAELATLADRTSRSRFPVVDEQGRVVGVVNLVDALLHEEDTPGLSARELMSESYWVKASSPLRQALTRMRRDHVAFAIVGDKKDEPQGVVTIKDLVEPITGELASW